MKKSFAALAALAAALTVVSTTAHAAVLTALEQRWIAGMTPVLQHARTAGMPVDIVVQPQEAPEAAPLALGFKDGRCKFVLSLRGNPEGEAATQRLPAGLEDSALELMAAHELGHCRRYLEGADAADTVATAAASEPSSAAP